ncbi:MAG: sigma 54-interacting transcriptional regulator, partial [Desulfatiglandaceae bacterium]
MANKPGYKELEQKVKKLEGEAFESRRLKEALQQRTHDIGERVKELNCLYGISSICEKQDISLKEILQGTVDLLPPSWQYPDITCSRIILENEEYISENFRETDWKQASDIIVHGKPVGRVEVYYLEEEPKSDEGPFLKEERSLINAVAERLGHITERKRSEEALWESEERYRDLYENAPNSYFSISAIDGSILGCNSAALRLFGYDRETLMRMKVFDLYAATPDGKSKAKEVFKRFKAGESIRDVELQMKRKQGEPTWISLSVAPLRDRDGKITESRSMVIDISDRKRAEEALERRNQELSSLNMIATTISRSIELEKVLAETLRTVLDLMGLKAGWIFLREGESDRLILTSHLGLSPEFVKEEMELPLGNCVCSRVMRGKKPLIAENILRCPRHSRSVVEGEGLARHASAPLISKDKVVGVMSVASEDLRLFSPEDLNLLTAIGHQVGMAIENARFFEDTRQKSLELQEAYERLKSLYDDLKAEREKTKSLRKALEDKFGLGNIVGKNDKMQAIYNLIESVSQSDSTVLIQGESGTGKELVARAIQLLGPRKEKPFVVANCSAYAQTLLESELFGHEKGAFTGAIRRKRGRFELADGGTIFLDEIGEIPPATQLLLLRVLQEKRFERVGGEDTIKVDVRVIAATNRNLARDMMEGRFREDLYYRLNVIPVIVPPLRER